MIGITDSSRTAYESYVVHYVTYLLRRLKPRSRRPRPSPGCVRHRHALPLEVRQEFRARHLRDGDARRERRRRAPHRRQHLVHVHRLHQQHTVRAGAARNRRRLRLAALPFSNARETCERARCESSRRPTGIHATHACPPRVATPRAPPDEPVPSHHRSRPRTRHLGSRFCRIEAAPAPVPANASLGRIPRVDNTICIFDKNFFLGFFFRTEHRTPITRRSTRHERGDKPHRSSRFLKSQGVGSSRPGCKKISEVETNRFEPIAVAFAT